MPQVFENLEFVHHDFTMKLFIYLLNRVPLLQSGFSPTA